MYIHLGWEVSVHIKDIIAVVNAPVNTNKRNLLHSMQGRNFVEVKKGKVVKTYVITPDKVYGTPLTTQTITKRIEAMSAIFAGAKVKSYLV